MRTEKVKILIVDDEPDMVSVIASILKKEGYETLQANSGQECLDKMSKELPDLVLMDLMMPGLDGFDTTKKIKMDPALKDVPVVMLTAKTTKEAKLEGFHTAYCDGYVEKPVKREDLVKVVRWMLD